MSIVRTFLFDGLPVRGAVVRLTDDWQALLARRRAGGGYAAPLRTLLGEMTAAAVLMQAHLRFDGALVLQISGDGPVKLAVAEVQHDLAFRATATVVGAIDDAARLEALVNAGGQGRCAITLDPRRRAPGQQPYQGVVPLHGDRKEPLQRIEQVLEHYMLQSEQLDTRMVLAADDRTAAGLLVQRMPVEGAGNLAGTAGAARNEDRIGRDEDFGRIALLAGTLTPEELLTLPVDRILHRLFWEETLRAAEPATPRFACRCSRDRVRQMLRGLGRQEADEVIAERGRIDVACEFCGQSYAFDAVDVGELFTPARDQPPGSAGVQ